MAWVLSSGGRLINFDHVVEVLPVRPIATLPPDWVEGNPTHQLVALRHDGTEYVIHEGTAAACQQRAATIRQRLMWQPNDDQPRQPAVSPYKGDLAK